MFNPKRFWLALLLGIVCGIICWGLIASGDQPVPWYMALSTIISRALIGFAIGISALRMGWWVQGIIFGAIFSLPMGLYGFYVPGKEAFIFIGSVGMGIIYGFLIELFTTVVFKARLQT